MSLFITFEGIEGCGKSTQAKLTADFLKSLNYEVFATREPGGPPISEKIRSILLDNENSSMLPETELLLYMASRAQHTGEWIIPALKSKKIVICDRYYDSTLAYQGAGREISSEIICELIKFSTFGLIPDKTFLIDISVDTGLKRMSDRTKDRLESEAFSFHAKVRKAFIDVAKSDYKRYTVINGENSIENVHNQIKEHIIDILKDGGK
jgi:dTMP kinase